MSTHPTPSSDLWAHDPEYCGTLDCPGCYAEMYVPRERRTPAEFSVYLFNAGRTADGYTNGDADEDAEAGIRGDDAGFYTDDGA